ncbi:MAG TPA: nucleotide pyrophosphohydrolase [Firmicutes bacterium]|nr:nucleotide pyrophosphohydrolase [Bacillota bacterium]
MKEFQEKLFAFRDERDWKQFHTPENLAKSVAIEAGELLECFQWSPNFETQAVKEELADVMMYCLLLADAMELDVVQILEEKLVKNGGKYPVQLSKGLSKKYTQLNQK